MPICLGLVCRSFLGYVKNILYADVDGDVLRSWRASPENNYGYLIYSFGTCGPEESVNWRAL